MRRFHAEVAIMQRRASSALAGNGHDIGRYRKRHAGGCGRANCGLCHPSKRWHTGADRKRSEHAWRRLEDAA